MSLRLLMDVHIPAEITERLRQAGVEVITAQEDGSDRLADERLIDRAYASGWSIFTFDHHFLAHATARQRAGQPFGCIFYAQQNVKKYRQYAGLLEVYAKAENPEDVAGRVIFIS
jgi:predicted nuclease of predicted toxin-antitoxin system